MTSRAVQLAKNEALFREVNERIEETSEEWSLDFVSALCECGNRGCSEPIELAPAEYAAVREHGDRFVLVPGHHDSEIERVVEETERFFVVEKIGEGARIARHLDPRSR